jgi:tRNA pseudouridine55 synthase
MSRRKTGDPVHGVVLLDKPAGLSSNQAMQAVRRLFNARKAGHTGTLDPFATGMLPVCLGEATKTTAFMLAADKAYAAVAQLGVATDTGDPEGKVIEQAAVPDMNDAAISQVLERFCGAIDQVPPMYSALKRDGKPLYELARQGIEVKREARRVHIRSLALSRWAAPALSFEVVCSKGTYIRTLAADIAGALGSCAHLTGLRRLWVAPFTQAPMVTLEQLQSAAAAGQLADYLLPADAGLPGWPVLQLDEAQQQRFAQGNAVTISTGAAASLAAEGPVRVHDAAARVLGLAEVRGGLVQPKRVFQLQ